MTKRKGGGCTVLKIIGILCVILLIVIGILTALLWKAAKDMGMGAGEVADYESRVNIWNTVAGNSVRSKLDDMDIDYKANLFLSTIRFSSGIVSREFRNIEHIADTFTYHYEIKRGYELETYEDEPYLIPYLAEGSNCAVIVIPGGGFGYKSMDGSSGEGRDVAVTLQQNGINAFVLHYRSNPYEYPIPYLDVQRAVRYLKYHAEDYGIEPEKIGLIGFSAGGNEIGGFLSLVMGNDLFPDNYTPDEVDALDDSVAAPAMIYPALSFDCNKPMLFCMFNADEVRDEAKRQEFLSLMDLKQHLNISVPQFIAYSTGDNMVAAEVTEAYITAAQNAGMDLTVVKVENQPHGFEQKHYMAAYLQWFHSLCG